MARTHPTQHTSRFRPIGAWRTTFRPKRKWAMPAKPIYLVGFVALVSFVAVLLSCSGSL